VKRYGIEFPFPRAFVARTLKRCGPEVAMKRILEGHFGFGWNPCREGTGQEGSEPEESQGASGYPTDPARSDIYIDYTVNLPQHEGYLVLWENWAPGWVATVDGQEAEIIPVDFIYRAVPVPKGKHKVRFEYRPRGMGMGLGLNMLGLVLIGVGLMWPRLRPQRFDLAPVPEEPPPPPPRSEDGWYH
jgi:hypothetical protein